MKRRAFLASPLLLPALSEAYGYPSTEGWVEPTVAERPVLKRQLHFEERTDGTLLLKTDAPSTPRKLVKKEVIDGVWGNGAYEFMRQPIHWAMIDAGWFDEDELWYPFDGFTEEYVNWASYYQPACEAHDLMCDTFGVVNFGIMSPKLPDIGLQMAEHPCTPRYATAKLLNKSWIPTFTEAVRARGAHFEIDPIPRLHENIA